MDEFIHFFDCLVYEMSENNKKFFKLLILAINSPKPKDGQLTIAKDKKMQLILTAEKLELGNVWHFCLENEMLIHFL